MPLAKKNPRANISQKIYRKQVEWRANKVKQVLIEGHSQLEISRIMQISQPTVSRDIASIKNECKIHSKNTLDLTMLKHMRVYTTMNAIIRNYFRIVHDERVNIRNKLRAMAKLREFIRSEMKLIDFGMAVSEVYEKQEQLRRKEEELDTREQELINTEFSKLPKETQLEIQLWRTLRHPIKGYKIEYVGEDQ